MTTRGSIGRFVAFAVFLAAALLLLGMADTAEATHYRYGTLNWEPTEIENQVVFNGAQAWRSSFFGNPGLGSLVNVGSIQTGDGNSVTLYVKVVSINTLNDWFFGVIVDAAGNEGIPYTYSAPNNNGDPWQASWSSCCRISPRSSGNYHVNNPDHSMTLITLVDLAPPENSAPKTNLPPINNCPLNTVCEIQVPHIDAEGDALSFRLATASEAGSAGYVPPGPPHAPNAAAIHPTTGLITWDTTGATHDGDWANWRTLYSFQVILEDGRTKTPLDFFIRIIPEDAEVPYWTQPAVCGTTQLVGAGGTLSFNVGAQSDDAPRVITLNHLGLPQGASFPLPTPANPVTGTFTWTPTLAQGGQHLIIFTAEDDLGLQAPPCPVTIIVDIQPPVFLLPSPCVSGEDIEGIRGIPLEFPVSALSPVVDRTVSLSLITAPSGAFLATGAPANPVTGTVHWPDPTAGIHLFVVKATDNIGTSATCTVNVHVIEPAGQSLATGLWAGTTVPVSAEYQTTGIDQRGHGAEAHHHATIQIPTLGLDAQAIEEGASLDLDGVVSTAHAHTEIARIELFGGLILLEGLSQDATLEYDLVSGATSLTTQPAIARAVIAGEAIDLDWEGEPVEVPLPGGGSITFFGQHEETHTQGAYYRETLVHAYIPVQAGPLAYGRHEVILGSTILQAGHAPPGFPFAAQPRLLLEQDDAGSGGDAGDTPAGAIPISTGVHHGSLPPGDTIDYYSIELVHGEKIQLLLQPAPRATLTGGGLHFLEGDIPQIIPPAEEIADMNQYTLRLFDPTGSEREISALGVPGAPERIELNADLDGTWHIEAARVPSATPPSAYNYTLAATVTPVPLLPQNELTTGGALCIPGAADIPTLSTGLRSGVLRDDDFEHIYHFTAEIGEIVTATLKPGETADGVDMALTLYDGACNQLQRSDLNLGGLKGTPESVTRLPSLYTGDYYLKVERMNGVGNYHLALTITNPLPTLPDNDAGSGEDAPENHQDADPAPALVFQGTLHYGDPGDAYLLDFEAGREAFVMVKMSLVSSVDVKLYRPDGTTLVPQAENVLGGQFVLYQFEAPTTGPYGLEIRPILGGGNYMVAWGQSLVALP